MKDFVVLTAVCLTLVLGVVGFLTSGSIASVFRTRITVHANTPEVFAEAAEAEVLPVQAPGLKAASLPAPRPEVIPASVAIPVETRPKVSVVTAETSLPLPWDVVAGDAGSDLVDSYGVPSL